MTMKVSVVLQTEGKEEEEDQKQPLKKKKSWPQSEGRAVKAAEQMAVNRETWRILVPVLCAMFDEDNDDHIPKTPLG